MVMNVDFILGFVGYTGKHTKIMLNQGAFKFKRSRAESITNIIMGLHLLLLLVLIILFGIADYVWATNRKWDYLFEKIDNYPFFSFKAGLTYYLLFNQLIPMSLVISTEIIKIFETAWIDFDHNFQSLEKDQQGKCLNFTLHEDLGAIKHIFTDKTGTLTSNHLTFRGITVGHDKGANHLEGHDIDKLAGNITKVLSDGSKSIDLSGNFSLRDNAHLLFMNIGLCNDVVVVQTNAGPEYHGSSTDEITLLDMAKRCGYEMTRRVNDNIYLKTPLQSEQMYKIIQKFEFNSDRKRMSVIAEMPS